MKFTLFAMRSLGAAALAGVLNLSAASGALAVEVEATTDVNVRTGPGTSFGILDALNRGERVTILECNSSGSWCYVDQDGPDGWVSARYLQVPPPPPPPPAPGTGSGSGTSGGGDCQLRLTLGSGRPTMELVCDTPAPPPPPPPPPVDKACFYRDANFQGPSFCLEAGRLDTLPPHRDNSISSVKLYGNANVRMCDGPDMTGYCARIVNDAPALGALLDDRASSLRVFVPGVPGTPGTGSNPPPGTVAFSKTVTMLPGQHLDLEDGTLDSAGTDIWYRERSGSTPARMVPIRGALIALGDGTKRGYGGCNAATYSADPVPLWQMPVSTYVCVRTNRDQISQFRVNGVAGDRITLSFTTWKE